MIKLNINPRGIKSGDCVIRAIAYATNQSWDDTYRGLFETGLKWKRIVNEKECYEKYLAKLGWVKHKQPRDDNNNKYTVDEFITGEGSLYKAFGNKVIISLAGHLTCGEYINGKYEIVDTWNCGRKCVSNFWTIS